MKQLSRWVTPIDANFTGSLERGKNYASVTFCDGFVCFLEKALPELEKCGIPATLFVPSGYVGRHPFWTDNNDHTGLIEQELLNEEQLKSLPSHLVTVGSHGVYHRNLVHLSESEAEEELCRSKADLEVILKREVNLLFFPYGEYNKTLLELARKAGYKRAFCNIPRPAFREPNEFLSGAIMTDPTDWGLEFILKVLGGYSWRPFAISVKRRLLRS
jgi:peptidoglycan/xylan/chitin deacetylase (PgdA/CDA1 family)